MQAEDATRLATGGSRFTAEAGGVGRIANRQLRTFQDLIAVKICDGDFCGWRKIEAVTTDHIHLVFLVRDLPRAARRGLIHQDRWPDLREAVLAHMRVKEEIDQRANQCGAIRAIRREGGPCHLCAALQIKDGESFRHCVVFWCWRRCWCTPVCRDSRVPRRRPGADAAVRLGATNWDVFVGRVRNSKERIF